MSHEHVSINLNNAEMLRRWIINQNKEYPNWRGEQFLNSSIKEMIEYFFIGNSINYKFWYDRSDNRFTYKNWSGSAAMWAYLTEKWNFFKVPRSVKELRNQLEVSKMPMWESRLKSLSEVNEILADRFNGKAYHICEQANWSAPQIVSLITTNFEMWKDESMGISFNKRAQLFVAMVHGWLGKQSFITEIENLSCLADYQVPKVLRFLGVFQYSKELSNLIDLHQPIACGSDLEFAIRDKTIKIGKWLSDSSFNIPQIKIDHILWSMGRNINCPHHLTETIAY